MARTSDRPPIRSAALLVTAVVFVACTDGPVTPEDSGPSLTVTSLNPAFIEVCKDASSPAGSYSFSVTQSGGRGGEFPSNELFG